MKALFRRLRHSPAARRIREIADRPLDGPARETEIRAYHESSGTKDFSHAWGKRLRRIVEAIDGGETHLSRVLGLIASEEEQKRGIGLDPGNYVALDREVRLPAAAAQSMIRGAVVRAVAAACTRKTESVIELGSGWGEHLAHIWLLGGPRRATYYACEISDAGRRCALVLASLEPSLRLEAPFFNYVAPDFGWHPRDRSEIVVYTVQSIEQVRTLPDGFVDRLLELGSVVKGVHLEPVGWQMVDPSAYGERMRHHRARCEEMKYNQDFWQHLQRAEAAGRIRIRTALPDFLGLVHNPVSLIAWEKLSVEGS